MIQKIFQRNKKPNKMIKSIQEKRQILESFSDEELINKHLGLIEEYRDKSDVARSSIINSDELKVLSLAIISEICRRRLGLTPYDVQIEGALALINGNFAQMKTGEGKTLTALLASYWGLIVGIKTYVITVNEYLCERDRNMSQKVFDLIGEDIGLVMSNMLNSDKQLEYSKSIIYITNSELAFDYLRNNITNNHRDKLHNEDYDFAIIDEADLILIDEASNPVIISEQSSMDMKSLKRADGFIKSLTEDDYEIDEDTLIPTLNEETFEKAEEYFNEDLTLNSELYHAVNQSLLANIKMKKDVDYIVNDEDEVLIVDKFTGRVLDGRRFQNGLHQAIEVKEGVEVKEENKAIARTTYQGLFKKFKLLSGMSGTIIESKDEFLDVYGTDVSVIPTHKAIQREDCLSSFFETYDEKITAIIDEIRRVKDNTNDFQPILVGTVSVEESELISRKLDELSISHRLLNAKKLPEEAEIISKAGQVGTITIATNMAGRGTDIKLSKEAINKGGLYVIGSGRNLSKRIDNQLIGRAGRQGEIGKSKFFVSLEDNLITDFCTTGFEKYVKGLKKKGKELPIEDIKLDRLVDEIQEVLDSMGTSARKMLVQTESFIDLQGTALYKKRDRILREGIDITETEDIITKSIEDKIMSFKIDRFNWEFDKVEEFLFNTLNINVHTIKDGKYNEFNWEEVTRGVTETELKDFLTKPITEKISELINDFSTDDLKDKTSHLYIKSLDDMWGEYLMEIELYKQSFAMGAMGEQDPVRKFITDIDEIYKTLQEQAIDNFIEELFSVHKGFSLLNSTKFYSAFPIKKNYTFNIKSSHIGEKINVEVYSFNGKVRETEVIVNEKGIAVVTVEGNLLIGDYVMVCYLNKEEIARVSMRILNERKEIYLVNDEPLELEIPNNSLNHVGDKDIKYKGSLINANKGTALSFDVTKGIDNISISKPKSQDVWDEGLYMFILFGENKPLYHKEFEIRKAL